MDKQIKVPLPDFLYIDSFDGKIKVGVREDVSVTEEWIRFLKEHKIIGNDR